MKTKFIPAIVMLSAGFLDCILAIHYGLGMYEFLIQLLIVLVAFFVIGDVIRFLLEKSMITMADKQEEPENGESAQEGEPEGDASVSEMENIESKDEQES